MEDAIFRAVLRGGKMGKMRINWYPIWGLCLLILLWVVLIAVGWAVWYTVVQPKVASTVRVLEIERSSYDYRHLLSR